MIGSDKPLLLLSTEIKSPPLSESARRKMGYLLRRLQKGELLAMPESRPLPAVGCGCHELRVQDAISRTTWRLVYRIEADCVVIVDIFAKKTQRLPAEVVWKCRARLRRYDEERRKL